MKIETWCGHDIRFVRGDDGEWWAVLVDVAKALGVERQNLIRRLDEGVFSKHPLPTAGGTQEALIVNEFGIYQAVFESRKPEARDFKRWVFEVIKKLRQACGLNSYQAFLMTDKEHQKKAMETLHRGLLEPTKRDYIKANTVADKVVSTLHGIPKMLRKHEMPPEMLEARQKVLDDAVIFCIAKERGLDISVSDALHHKYGVPRRLARRREARR